MSRRDAGYAYRVTCPSCHGPLYFLESERLYYCANHACGPHGAGLILTDAQAEHDGAPATEPLPAEEVPD